MDIGNAIREIRKELGYKQSELAKKCNISINTLSLIERNKTFPSRYTLNLLCDKMGVSVGYVLFMCITDVDLPDQTRAECKALYHPLRSLLLEHAEQIQR